MLLFFAQGPLFSSYIFKNVSIFVFVTVPYLTSTTTTMNLQCIAFLRDIYNIELFEVVS